MAFQRLYENLHLVPPGDLITSGPWEIPDIVPQQMPFFDEWVPFNDLSKPFTKNQGVQMFVDDYRIQRLWANPSQYVGLLSKAACVLSPDFSIYTDVPAALNLFNHYRKHWLGCYWQKNGLTVIPTVCWGDESTFTWCFDGEPERSTVAVSSIGTQRQQQTKAAFLRGYDAMLERLQPETILFWGNVPAECRGNICPVEAFYKTVERRREAKNVKS